MRKLVVTASVFAIIGSVLMASKVMACHVAKDASSESPTEQGAPAVER